MQVYQGLLFKNTKSLQEQITKISLTLNKIDKIDEIIQFDTQ